MFGDMVLAENKRMVQRWQERCAELYGKRELKANTDSGIEIKPIYTPDDIEDMEYKDIGLPGEYPFTRGHSPLGYQVEPWMMRSGYGYGTGEEGRRRRAFLERLGMSQAVGTERPAPALLFVDLPTQRGYDPDEAAARGRVGRDGISISNMKDIEAIFEGVPLDQVETSFIAMDASMVCTAMYIVYAQRHGIPQHKLRMRQCNLLYRFWGDSIYFPPSAAIKLMIELMKYCSDFMPLARTLSLTGYNTSEAGATPIQEIAFTLATAIAITEEWVKAGFDPDDIAPKFYGANHVGMDFFEEIAKIRATRRLWSKIFKERFGCKKRESLSYSPGVQIGGSLLTAQEPLNNIIRITTMALSAVLAGVDWLFTPGYDEAFSIPSEGGATAEHRFPEVAG